MDLNDLRIENARKGDQRAKMELYMAYSSAMYNTSYRILKEKMEAEDAMHDAFIKAFTKLDEFIGQVSFGAWLKRIVVNTSLDKLKKKKPLLFEPSDVLEIEDEETSTDQNDIQLEVRKVLRCVEGLPDGYRTIVNLHLIEGYDHEEISQILGITSSTSRSQFARAKKALKNELTTVQNA